MDLVSIIIPTHNRRELVERAVWSCLEQDYPQLEIIVVDDGSTDGTEETLAALAKKDSRVRWARQENRGQCAARNAGFQMSKGALLKFLDSDDALTPGAISTEVSVLKRSGSDFAVGEQLGHDEDKFAQAQQQWEREFANALEEAEQLTLRAYLLSHRGTLNEVLMKRCAFAAAGGFCETIRAAEEINFVWRLYFAMPELEVVRHSWRVVYKRYSLQSLAAVMRSQKETPWTLLSLQDVVERLLERRIPLDAELKQHLFDTFYQNIVYARRNGRVQYVEPALALWEKGGVPAPKLKPWYHDQLHRRCGFRKAEKVLDAARNLLKRKQF